RVLGGLVDVELHQQLLGFVGLADRRGLPVEEVRRQRIEALAREHVGHALHLGDQPPPLLDDDHPRTVAGCRAGEIPARRAAVALERDLLSHRYAPTPTTFRSTPMCSTSSSITSPGRSHSGGLRPIPTPSGVPVMITSPS